MPDIFSIMERQERMERARLRRQLRAMLPKFLLRLLGLEQSHD